jgi:Mg-chelatase subunit ChlI
MERNMAFEIDPEGFRETFQPDEMDLSEQIEVARRLIPKVHHSSRDLITIASLTASLGVDGHRPDLVILKAARAQAAFEGRTSITELDIAKAAELALPHRMKRGPFEKEIATMEELRDRIEQLSGGRAAGNYDEEMEPDPNQDSKPKAEKKT